jgi:hypothetical protein
MKSQKTIFLIKAGILAAPLIILLVSYVCLDPFKVLRKYDSYLESGGEAHVALNAGYVSVETFLRNYPKIKYDSIIFGNSRSRFYPVADWKKYITATECFHFDAAGESLYGIYKKFEFLQKNNIQLKNVLIIMDSFLLEQVVDNERYLNKQHPLLSSESPFSFQLRFLKTYLNAKFLVPYLDLKIRGKMRPYMTEVLSDTSFLYNAITNEVTYDAFEKMIERNRDDYYLPRKNMFPPQDSVEKYSKAVIGDKQKEQLLYIKDQLDKNKTSYRIVISPLYYQKKINAKDLKILNEIFGKDYVFDFSGKNEITSTIYNYYESSHYRPHVSKWILRRIY